MQNWKIFKINQKWKIYIYNYFYIQFSKFLIFLDFLCNMIRLKAYNDSKITMTHRLSRLSSSNHDILFALSKSMRDRVVANRNYDATSVDTDWWVYGRVFRFYTASYCVCHYEIFKLELHDVSSCFHVFRLSHDNF